MTVHDSWAPSLSVRPFQPPRNSSESLRLSDISDVAFSALGWVYVERARSHIATGPHAGRKALTLRTAASNPSADSSCIARLWGFSLNAGTRCRAHERNSLDRLCRYITRPTVLNECLSFNDRGQVVYRLKHPFGGGSEPPLAPVWLTRSHHCRLHQITSPRPRNALARTDYVPDHGHTSSTTPLLPQ